VAFPKVWKDLLNDPVERAGDRGRLLSRRVARRFRIALRIA
jgi:hypothetical protein